MHTCKFAHAHAYARQTKEEAKKKKKEGRKNKIWDVFECVLLLHYSVLHLPSMVGNRETGATIRV